MLGHAQETSEGKFVVFEVGSCGLIVHDWEEGGCIN